MGNEHSKNKSKKSKNTIKYADNYTPDEPTDKPEQSVPELTSIDLEFLTYTTGSSKSEIQNVYDSFVRNNPDVKLDQNEFIRFYNELRPEPAHLLDDISVFVFRAFDKDGNGFISFNEFMIAYALTSRGDLKKKLEYAFILYDDDSSGYLDYNEIKAVLNGMLDLLGAEKKDSEVIAEQCLQELDTTKDGRVSKDEFVEGLLRNYSLRSLMSPFN